MLKVLYIAFSILLFTSTSKTKSKTKYKNLHQVQSLSHYMQDLHLMQDFA